MTGKKDSNSLLEKVATTLKKNTSKLMMSKEHSSINDVLNNTTTSLV